jgi:hypothetical protein
MTTWTNMSGLTCDLVQARHDRYSGGIVSIYGSISSSQSDAYSTLGVSAGHLSRAWEGSTATGWKSF